MHGTKYIPVSYTHLDVYKRQAEGGFKFIEAMQNNDKIVKLPKIIMLLPMLREDLFDRLNDYAVSYTHLDVYKRQLLLL